MKVGNICEQLHAVSVSVQEKSMFSAGSVGCIIIWLWNFEVGRVGNREAMHKIIVNDQVGRAGRKTFVLQH